MHMRRRRVCARWWWWWWWWWWWARDERVCTQKEEVSTSRCWLGRTTRRAARLSLRLSKYSSWRGVNSSLPERWPSLAAAVASQHFLKRTDVT
jgi:hypothetical protein